MSEDIVKIWHSREITDKEFDKLPAESRQKMLENCFGCMLSRNNSDPKLKVFQETLESWCKQNCSGLYMFGVYKSKIYFLADEDATGFKLRWS